MTCLGSSFLSNLHWDTQKTDQYSKKKLKVEPSVLREVATNIAGYFRDFLESDFKRMQAPSRRIILQSDSGFRSGMRLKPYEVLDRDFWRLLHQPSGEPLEIKIAPRKYIRNLSAIVQKVITEQIAAIEESQLVAVRSPDRPWETLDPLWKSTP